MTPDQAKDTAFEVTMRPLLEERVQGVLQRFNYVKLEQLMSVLGWEWVDVPRSHPPSADQIRQSAASLFKHSVDWWIEHPWVYSVASTGGLMAEIDEAGWPALRFDVMNAEMMPEEPKDQGLQRRFFVVCGGWGGD